MPANCCVLSAAGATRSITCSILLARSRPAVTAEPASVAERPEWWDTRPACPIDCQRTRAACATYPTTHVSKYSRRLNHPRMRKLRVIVVGVGHLGKVHAQILSK